MKHAWPMALAALVALAAWSAGDPRLARSREIAARFQQELSSRLTGALSAGGPVQAIEVCSEVAPVIAARLSAQTGARVARTASRARNPDNAPDPYERRVLEDLARGLKAGATDAPEHFEAVTDGGARYLKAIVMQSMCLVCHGSALAPDVEAAIASRYPADRATGFQAGDLRGAIVIEWAPDTLDRQADDLIR